VDSVVLAWQLVVGVRGLAAALVTLGETAAARIRGGSFTAAMEATWVSRREYLAAGSAAFLGWAVAVTVLKQRAEPVSGLVIALAGTLFFAVIYWMITKGGRRPHAPTAADLSAAGGDRVRGLVLSG
jgi:hypothetical protein